MIDAKADMLLFINNFTSSNIFKANDVDCTNFSFENIISPEGYKIASLKFRISIYSQSNSFFNVKFSGKLQYLDKWFTFQGSFIRHIKLGFIIQHSFDSFFSI